MPVEDNCRPAIDAFCPAAELVAVATVFPEGSQDRDFRPVEIGLWRQMRTALSAIYEDRHFVARVGGESPVVESVSLP